MGPRSSLDILYPVPMSLGAPSSRGYNIESCGHLPGSNFAHLAIC